jgi:hypothetical protein
MFLQEDIIQATFNIIHPVTNETYSIKDNKIPICENRSWPYKISLFTLTTKCMKCLLLCSHPYPIWATLTLNFAVVLKNLDLRFQSFKVSNFMSVSILQNSLRHSVASGVQVNQHFKGLRSVHCHGLGC